MSDSDKLAIPFEDYSPSVDENRKRKWDSVGELEIPECGNKKVRTIGVLKPISLLEDLERCVVEEETEEKKEKEEMEKNAAVLAAFRKRLEKEEEEKNAAGLVAFRKLLDQFPK